MARTSSIALDSTGTVWCRRSRVLLGYCRHRAPESPRSSRRRFPIRADFPSAGAPNEFSSRFSPILGKRRAAPPVSFFSWRGTVAVGTGAHGRQVPSSRAGLMIIDTNLSPRSQGRDKRIARGLRNSALIPVLRIQRSWLGRQERASAARIGSSAGNTSEKMRHHHAQSASSR